MAHQGAGTRQGLWRRAQTRSRQLRLVASQKCEDAWHQQVVPACNRHEAPSEVHTGLRSSLLGFSHSGAQTVTQFLVVCRQHFGSEAATCEQTCERQRMTAGSRKANRGPGFWGLCTLQPCAGLAASMLVAHETGQQHFQMLCSSQTASA